MMQAVHDVKPIRTTGLDCLECLIATMAEHWGRGYQLMFLQHHTFDYIRSEEHPLARNLICSPLRSFDNLLTYHGIAFERFIGFTGKTALAHIYDQVERGTCLIVELLAASIPWDVHYESNHMTDTHAVLVIGVDRQGERVLCTDSFYEQYRVELPAECIRKGYVMHAAIRLAGDETSGLDDVTEALLIQLFRTDVQRRGEAIHQLAEDIASRDMAVEVGAEPEQSEFVQTLFRISKLYKQLGLIAGQLQAARSGIGGHTWSECLDIIGNRWGIAAAMMMKLACAPKDAKLISAVVQRLKQIAELEQEMAVALADSGRSQPNTIPYSKHGAVEIGDYAQFVNVELDAYYNNHGFYKNADTRAARLACDGSFALDDGTLFGRTLAVGRMKFKLPRLRPDKDDNLSCQGQVVPIQPGKYSAICLLACSEWGHATEPLMVIDEDGQLHSVMMQFTDWYEHDPQYGEQAAWRGKLGRWAEDGTICKGDSMHTIYADCYPLELSGAIIGLQLPYCPNLHLFAISLIRLQER